MISLYGLKTCDTCRKALKEIKDVRFQDVRVDGVPDIVLRRAYAEFGARLLNTRSTTWRGLSDEERAQDPLALLKAHPTLMKRPLIQTDADLFLGWDVSVRTALSEAGHL